MGELQLLQNWYVVQCDGDWEHSYGISIETLDNPGWKLTVDLAGTDAEHRSLAHVKIERSESDWIHYRVAEQKFEAFMGPDCLPEGIRTFLTWYSSTAE